MRNEPEHNTNRSTQTDTRSEDLRDSKMMAHLLDAMESGEDIGHFGRLTFAMVARHFMDEGEIVSLMGNQPGFSEDEARAILLQVNERDYNPPKRERILEWQSQQDFPICPNPDDPNACNVYRELRFPDNIYERIGEFWMEKVEAEEVHPDDVESRVDKTKHEEVHPDDAE